MVVRRCDRNRFETTINLERGSTFANPKIDYNWKIYAPPERGERDKGGGRGAAAAAAAAWQKNRAKN